VAVGGGGGHGAAAVEVVAQPLGILMGANPKGSG